TEIATEAGAEAPTRPVKAVREKDARTSKTKGEDLQAFEEPSAPQAATSARSSESSKTRPLSSRQRSQQPPQQPPPQSTSTAPRRETPHAEPGSRGRGGKASGSGGAKGGPGKQGGKSRRPTRGIGP